MVHRPATQPQSGGKMSTALPSSFFLGVANAVVVWLQGQRRPLAALRLLAYLALSAGCACPGFAANFAERQDSNGRITLKMQGRIDRGDLRKLRATVGRNQSVEGLELDSPGGNVAAAMEIGRYLVGTSLFVRVEEECSSACFLIFAAARAKFVTTNARIGVHSASIAGKETAQAALATVSIARLSAEFGAPPEVVGKLVQTDPKDITWLSRDDLVRMGAKIVAAPPAPRRAIPFLACMALVAQVYHLPPRVLPAMQAADEGGPGQVYTNRDGSEDLGIMRVNSRWISPLAKYTGLPAAKVRDRLLFDPCFNIAAAGSILRTNLNETEGDLLRAVGNYHSREAGASLSYQDRVAAAADRLFGRPLAED